MKDCSPDDTEKIENLEFVQCVIIIVTLLLLIIMNIFKHKSLTSLSDIHRTT